MKPHGPILSVVITSCNQLNHLKFTLLALRDQTPDVNYEIIAVDCGSTDGSDQFLTAQAQTGTMSGVLRTVLNSEPKGRTAARNQAAHLARGQFLMFLDPGMIVGPGWWESLIRTLDRDPQVGAVAGKIILPDGRIDHAGLALLEWWDQPESVCSYGNRLTARSLLAGKPADVSRSNWPTRVQALAGEAILVRAAAFFAVGGFSARLGGSHQQGKADFAGDLAGIDLSLRLGCRGWNCVYRHESVMTRLRHPGDANVDHENDLARDETVFNTTWLGRARGDFKIMGSRGTLPAENMIIQRYIEPVISFGEATSLVPGNLARGHASVIVVTRGDLDSTRQCVLTLLAHTDSIHELIFVDCGTADGTRPYLDELAQVHHQVKVIEAAADAGYAEARNLGLAVARGRHLVLLDSRAVVTPGWLDALTTMADLHPQVGAVGPLTSGLSGVQCLNRTDYDPISLRGLNSFADRLAREQGGFVDKTSRLGGFCLLIKRELLARIGGLDERFSQGFFEDNDFCLRARLAGYESMVARGCFVHFSGAASADEAESDQLKAIQDQWSVFCKKWNVPAGVGLGDPLDQSALLAGGYRVESHFQPLPEGKAGTRNAPAWQTQAARA
jgi:GT2 family glycosyltransferase